MKVKHKKRHLEVPVMCIFNKHNQDYRTFYKQHVHVSGWTHNALNNQSYWWHQDPNWKEEFVELAHFQFPKKQTNKQKNWFNLCKVWTRRERIRIRHWLYYYSEIRYSKFDAFLSSLILKRLRFIIGLSFLQNVTHIRGGDELDMKTKQSLFHIFLLALSYFHRAPMIISY